MDALLVTALGFGVGLGVLLCIQAALGNIVVPTLDEFAPGLSTEATIAWLSGGLITGLVVFAVTGWLVPSVATGVIVVFGHRIRRERAERDEFIVRTESIASWTEMIRDNMAAAAGLEQALIASSRLAPEPIKDEVARFIDRTETMSLVDALALLGDDLDNPSSDMVVVALTNAVRMQARELGPLLSRLAETIRSEVRMRTRIEVGRARIRTSARIVVATTVALVAFLFVFSRNLLNAYDTLEGQLWLLVVLAVFGAGLWMMRHLAKIETPARFSARRTRPAVVDR